MKRIEKAVLIGLILSILVGNFSAFASDCNSVRKNVLRLHILANSDSTEDQALKLKVRDRILEETGDLFESTADLKDAEAVAMQNLEKVKLVAEAVVCAEGYDYPIEVTFCNMYFNTRTYDKFTMPAGRYDALRVTIGNAEGKNWWCVLYPPLCLPAAQPEKQLEDVLEEDEMEVVSASPKYEIRFAFLEIFERIKEHFFS